MRLTLIAVCVLLLSGCRQSIFKPDLLDARLPRYTETGNNVGGALIDGLAWTIRHTCREDDDPPSICRDQLIVSRDSTFIRLEMEAGVLYDETQITEVSAGIAFMVSDSVIEWISDLEDWHGREITLDGIGNYADVSIQGVKYTGGKGKLFIRSAKFTPGQISSPFRSKATMSGTFAFSLPDHYPISEVTSGRFDFEVEEIY